MIAVTAGIIGGVAVARSLQDDHRTGLALTKEKYAAGFEERRKALVDSDGSVPEYVLVCVIAMFLIAGLYEAGGIIAAPAVGWLDETFARRAAERGSLQLDDTDL